MHPKIASFPSFQFYENKLMNGENTLSHGEKLYNSFRKPSGFSSMFELIPYKVFDISYGRESMIRNSLVNIAEIDFVVKLCEFLLAGDKESLISGNVGIISPYKQQISGIRSQISTKLGKHVLNSFDIATIDGFQGREKGIIILSCVRAASDSTTFSIGFLNDLRRMNVGITRAKHCMFIVCNSEHLQRNQVWRALINDAKERGCYTRVEDTDIKDINYTKWLSNSDISGLELGKTVSEDKNARSEKSSDTNKDESKIALNMTEQLKNIVPMVKMNSPTETIKESVKVSQKRKAQVREEDQKRRKIIVKEQVKAVQAKIPVRTTKTIQVPDVTARSAIKPVTSKEKLPNIVKEPTKTAGFKKPTRAKKK